MTNRCLYLSLISTLLLTNLGCDSPKSQQRLELQLSWYEQKIADLQVELEKVSSEAKRAGMFAVEARQIADNSFRLAQKSKDIAVQADERSQRNEEVLNAHFKKKLYR